MSPRAAYVIAEVEHLRGTDSPESIARRLGYERGDALIRLLERNGRPDLAASFRGLRAWQVAA